MKSQRDVGRSTDERPTLYRRIKAAVAIAAQVIIAAPLKLSTKIVKGAQYTALLIGLLDQLDKRGADDEEDDDVP